MRRSLKLKLISIVSGVALILIIGALYYLKTQHRFLTYEDPQGRFTMKYPADWKFLNKRKDEAAVIFYSPKESALDLHRENINIVVRDISENPMEINEYSEMAIREIQLVFEQWLTVVESKSISFSTRPGYKLVYVGEAGEGEADVKIMHLWTLADNKAYQFTYTATVDEYDRYIAKANNMARSFRIK